MASMELTGRKALSAEVKAEGDQGIVVARFSTLGVVDSDGDVVREGAFRDGAEVPIGAYGHDSRALPIGRGVIRVGPDAAARLEGQFFMDTEHGKAAFLTLKGLGPLAEWSYIFQAETSQGEFEGRQVRFLDAIDVWSVDPVLRGASVNTGTEFIKSASHDGLSFAQHGSLVLDAAAAFAERAKERGELRGRAGRGLSAADRSKLLALSGGLASAAEDINLLLATGQPDMAEELAREEARFQEIISTLRR